MVLTSHCDIDAVTVLHWRLGSVAEAASIISKVCVIMVRSDIARNRSTVLGALAASLNCSKVLLATAET